MTTAPAPVSASPLAPGDKVSHKDFGVGFVLRAGGFASTVTFENNKNEIVANSNLKMLTLSAANDNHRAEDLKFIDPADWFGLPVPSREWYAEDLIPMRQVTIVNGDGGVGKSLLTLQIAAAGAMAVDTLGMKLLSGRSLYVGAEDEGEEFQRRLIDISKAHDRTLADLTEFRLLPLADRDALLSIPDRAGKMVETPLMKTISEFALQWKPRLIVFDTAADLFGGDEIKRGQVRQFIGMLRALAISVDCAVILLAHPSVQGMQSGTGSSGSTAWNNSVRSRLYLTRPESKDADPDLRILKTMKINYGKTGAETKMKWKEGVFVLDDGKPSAGSVMIAARAERVFRDAISAMNRSGERVAKTKGVNYAPKVISERPEAKGLSVKTLEAAMHQLFDDEEIKIVIEGPPSKPRQRIILAAEDFGPKD
ncbi:AAA family ATPase [Agrobacterium tumefaciens]|uniref:AAA family ATPase n=1 Tax=Agrobacterium tumefaciens TaxID=358 RepID=UPI002244D133|nr:AAA family ATPase [Agrobacterium tumefaciens]MCW8057673.1 AAA family ATPase [Agrobacterium tumefaciens]MCW8146953.1 AAA family ATPase [Agrobacterium tumefaciens]